MNIKNILDKAFIPFDLEVSRIVLFEIYPAKLVKEISCK